MTTPKDLHRPRKLCDAHEDNMQTIAATVAASWATVYRHLERTNTTDN